ncbi:hypothetical protein [Streptomyces shaanxiensis]|uniref:Uncharacterized protein n=1 Tax=Streptomyces shaanxiensis TaxID=653357 RepID=A0ABP7UXG5_9ACTN
MINASVLHLSANGGEMLPTFNAGRARIAQLVRSLDLGLFVQICLLIFCSQFVLLSRSQQSQAVSSRYGKFLEKGEMLLEI